MKLSKEVHKLRGSISGYMKEHAGDEMGKDKSVKHKALQKTDVGRSKHYAKKALKKDAHEMHNMLDNWEK